MRVKLVFLAGSLAAFVVALIFGADMCAQIGQTQSGQSQSGQGQEQTTAESGEAAAEGVQVPNVTEGGVQNVNQNLRKMKSDMHEQMKQHQDRLDDRIERSGTQK